MLHEKIVFVSLLVVALYYKFCFVAKIYEQSSFSQFSFNVKFSSIYLVVSIAHACIMLMHRVRKMPFSCILSFDYQLKIKCSFMFSTLSYDLI